MAVSFILPLALEYSELVAGVVSHAILSPWGIHNDFDFDGSHAFHRLNNLSAVGNQLRTSRAHGAGHSHFNADIRLRRFFRTRRKVYHVNQAEIDDIYKQLGVNDLLELLTDFFFAKSFGHATFSNK